MNKIGKFLGREIGWILLKIFNLIVSRLSEDKRCRLAKRLANLLYLIPLKHKKIILDNLRFAFKEKSKEEISKLAKSVYQNLTLSLFEMLTLSSSPRGYNQAIEVLGLKNLDQALLAGKGAVAISCHLGNFALLGEKMASLGYPFTMVMRDPKDKRVADFFHKILDKQEVKVIPDRPITACVRSCFASLKKREILYLMLDQNVGEGGVFVNFLGREASTHTGPVVFSLKTGAAIIPMFIVRKDNHHQIIIEPEVKLGKFSNYEEDLSGNTAVLSEIIESFIRRYPEQWWWLHQRWKRQPEAPLAGR